jgi:hypothetical protein
MTMLVQVKSDYFCAGLVLDDDGICIEATPILRSHRVIGKRRADLSAYFRRRGWRARIVSPARQPETPSS